MRDLLHTEIFQGWKITLYARDEDHDWRDDFDETVDDFAEIQTQLDNGKLSFFYAEVVASRGGFDLAHEYLGSCMFATTQEFLECGCYEDMRQAVVTKAEQMLSSLTEPITDTVP